MKGSQIRVRPPVERKFFKFNVDCRNRPHGLVLINQAAYDADRADFYNDLRDRPDPERRLQRRSQIFPLSEALRFRLDPKIGGWPADLHVFSDYWLVSDRLKQTLEFFDPGAMQFVRCDVLVPAAGDRVLSDVPIWYLEPREHLEMRLEAWSEKDRSNAEMPPRSYRGVRTGLRAA